MRHAVRNGLDGQDLAGIREDLVPGVEHAKLHRLVVVDPVGERGADAVPVRTPGAEIVLDDPLAEVLVGDGHRVVDAELPCQRELPRAGRRHDAVDHRVGEGAVRVDPVGEVRVGRPCERNHGPPQHRAVALQVVAALAGERSDAPIAPKPERRQHCAERGARAIRVAGIVPDVRMLRVQTLRHGVDVVTALGDGQRDDPDCGIGHPAHESGMPFLDRHVVDHRADDLRRRAGRVELDQRRQAVLAQELLALRGVVRANAGADDCPVVVEPELEQPVQVPGLVRAVEVAEPDMDDAGGQRGAVISRPRDRLRQVAQRGVRKANHGHAPGRPRVLGSFHGRRRRFALVGEASQAMRSPWPSNRWMCSALGVR